MMIVSYSREWTKGYKKDRKEIQLRDWQEDTATIRRIDREEDNRYKKYETAYSYKKYRIQNYDSGILCNPAAAARGYLFGSE